MKPEILFKKITQGGMGIYISNWLLASKTSQYEINGKREALGTVSGTGIANVLANILQNGDPGGHYRRALASFPYPEIAQLVLENYFIEDGKKKNQRYKNVPKFNFKPKKVLIALTVCANYALVWLAKEGHDNPISINYLEKVQFPHIYSIVGAMIAGVDCISMGAGIPFQIPEILEDIRNGENPKYKISLENNTKYVVDNTLTFDLEEFFGEKLPKLQKPYFLPIVSSDAVANVLLNKCPKGSIDGFIVENHNAAGHNAPPRNKLVIDFEPVYGERDDCNFERMKSFGIPFWIGGAMASPDSLAYALSIGAQGIQVGSIFELTEESGLCNQLKQRIRKDGFNEKLIVKSYTNISPTLFPFNIVILRGTISDKKIYDGRKKVCNIGLLRTPYVRDDGSIGYRCPAECGNGYYCLCNVLMATICLNNKEEPPGVTFSKDYKYLKSLMKDDSDKYNISDVLKYLLK